MKSQSIVLNHSQIQQKTERMALEILESTFEQTQIFIGGIAGNGFVFAQRLLKELQNNGVNKCKIEGRNSNDWKLIDAIDIIVHIFHPEKREFYDLEKMWCDPTEINEAIT